MSYIFDAQKKSEEERQKSRTRPAGSGFTFVNSTVPAKKKFTFGLILTSFMLLVALILGGGWWWSQQDQEETATTKERDKSASTTDDGAVQQDRDVPSKQAQH